MLRLFIGRAGSGKTSAVMREVGEEVRLKRGGNIIIVPDQFSFEAERELLLSCGNTASLYAEIIGFSALKDKLTERIGSDFGNYVDRAGRLISLACAVGELGSELKLSAVRFRCLRYCLRFSILWENSKMQASVPKILKK